MTNESTKVNQYRRETVAKKKGEKETVKPNHCRNPGWKKRFGGKKG